VTPGLDPALSLALRLALAWLLLAAALHKARHRNAFRAALAGYRLLPGRWVAAAAWGLAAAELSAGLLLLSAPARDGAAWDGATPAGAALAGGLFVLYGGAIGLNLARGRRHIDCGCAGPGGRRTLSEGLLLRNVVLVLAVVTAALPPPARPWVWIDAVTVSGGVAALALLYAAIDAVLANAPRLAGLRGGAWPTR
jgi:hypothetical protein